MSRHDEPVREPEVDPDLAPPEHSTLGTVFAFIFLIGGILITIGFVAVAGWQLSEQKSMLTTWPATEGTVLRTDVQRFTTRTGGHRSSSTTTSYRPVIEHSYFVNGTEYTGERAIPSDRDGPSEWAHSIIRPYKPGDAITVYYDPADPSKSFVVRYWDDLMLHIALFASFFPAFIAFLFTAGGKRKYALKWILPLIGTGVFALGLAASAAVYFGNVPRQDWTQRSLVIFGIAMGLLCVAMLLTWLWRNQHMDWRREQAVKRR